MQPTHTNVAAAAVLWAVLGATFGLSGCGESEDSSAEWRKIQETPGAAPVPNDAPFVTASLAWNIPAAWAYREPSGSVRKAEFVVTAEAGEAELVFFHFGAGQGGDVEANLARWARAVLDEAGEPVEPAIEIIENDSLRTVSATYTGTYMSGPPRGPKVPVENSVLLGAVVEGGAEGSVFLRLTGPASVVEPLEDAWRTMLKSVRSAGG